MTKNRAYTAEAQRLFDAVLRIEQLEAEVRRLRRLVAAQPRQEALAQARKLLLEGYKPYVVAEMTRLGKTAVYTLKAQIDKERNR